METKKRKNDGRTRDLSLRWLTKKHGAEWATWRLLAEEWMLLQDSGLLSKLSALAIFFDIYLINYAPWSAELNKFFEGNTSGQKVSSNELKQSILDNTNRGDNRETSLIINHIVSFINWLIDTHFSTTNDIGHRFPLYVNPLIRVESRVNMKGESVHNPLPYRYICDLRKILCPKSRGHFSDWIWAQLTSASNKSAREWFDVNENVIDKSDPDCVWRVNHVIRNGKNIKIYQIWSPVSAMVIFIKLHLPLRTYQVRMLDSGEADTLRYENGKWIKNLHSFAYVQYRKGVFRQFKDNATGIEMTGIYVSTNKTADQNKDVIERGYEIPWQNECVLYWLEKLRNWQEKYNPINEPTDCMTLETKHTSSKKSKAYLSAMGHCCFLFRNAAAKNLEDRNKPIIESPIYYLWYKLLQKLECNLLSSGDTLSNGAALKLVHDYGENHKLAKTKTEFPLHSLRVSLITCYIMDAKLPLPIVSKLLAGHSRILMTVYYTKITPAVMKEKMKEADQRLEDISKQSIRTFLKDAEMRQIKCKMAYQDDLSIQNALVNRNPIGWELRHHGLCLAGGNAIPSAVKTIAGCWNGGELVQDAEAHFKQLYQAVPHGPENCVRCRWFITDARYLPALTAHLNFMSYKAHEAANLAVKLEADIQRLEELKYQAETNEVPFLQHNEMQTFHRRYEKQLVEADEYTKDWIATFGLIRRLIEIEQNRKESDTSNKLIAVGSKTDINICFTDTTSELLHLSLLCEDAEIYPDLQDSIQKTSIIQKRSHKLSRMMMNSGYVPYLLMLDTDQQLLAANAMMRQMAMQANPSNKLEGFNFVANYLEFGQFMEDKKLFDIGVNALEKKINNHTEQVSIKSLANISVNRSSKNAN